MQCNCNIVLIDRYFDGNPIFDEFKIKCDKNSKLCKFKSKRGFLFDSCCCTMLSWMFFNSNVSFLRVRNKDQYFSYIIFLFRLKAKVVAG